MSKSLKIIDESSGEILENVNFNGGYNIQYVNSEDSGQIIKITKLDNGKFGEKHCIKNYIYQPIAEKLTEKFAEINSIISSKILFLENTEWEPGGAKNDWIARTRKANPHLIELTGYKWIIETRKYFIEKMSREQLIILIYHEMRHIDTSDDGLKKHDIEDWNNIIATFGKNWDSTKAQLKDILSDDFISWKHVIKSERQMSMYDYDNVIQMANLK